MEDERSAVDLYWLPLGAGGYFVRLNGRIFERLSALIERRPSYDLYHSALEIRVRDRTFTIEMGPVHRGVPQAAVAEGPVGARWAGRSSLFRYEIRVCRDGGIPDIDEAVESPRRLTDDEACARRLLDWVPRVPTLIWGRDELHTGDMWNSNSVISWLLVRSGLDTAPMHPPAGGRAPGWQAGLTIARMNDGTVSGG
jgi:hypothetical protein